MDTIRRKRYTNTLKVGDVISYIRTAELWSAVERRVVVLGDEESGLA
jgi:hypothetical protein